MLIVVAPQETLKCSKSFFFLEKKKNWDKKQNSLHVHFVTFICFWVEQFEKSSGKHDKTWLNKLACLSLQILVSKKDAQNNHSQRNRIQHNPTQNW